jgi:hypothetical protein
MSDEDTANRGMKRRTHKVVATKVVPTKDGEYGVFEFDGSTDFADEVGSKQVAEFYANAQLGEEIEVGVNPLLLSAAKVEELKSRKGRGPR